MNKYFEKANWHPLADMFPLLADTELQELATDIKEHGLMDLIVLYEDKVLDGRNRLLAMKLAGIPLRQEHFVSFRDVRNPRCAQGDDCTPLSWVISKNLKRRHLTTSQRAAIAAELEPKFAEEAKKRQQLSQGRGQKGKVNLPDLKPGQARDEAAAAMQVSPRSVQNAKKLKQEDSEAFEEVKQGKTNLNAALKPKKNPPSQNDSPAEQGELPEDPDLFEGNPDLLEAESLHQAVCELLTRFPGRVEVRRRGERVTGLTFTGIQFSLDEFESLCGAAESK